MQHADVAGGVKTGMQSAVKAELGQGRVAAELDKQHTVFVAMMQRGLFIRETCFRRRKQCTTV